MRGGAGRSRYVINERIRAKEVRLIDDEGAQLGVVPLPEALSIANEKDLDLLLISDSSTLTKYTLNVSLPLGHKPIS